MMIRFPSKYHHQEVQEDNEELKAFSNEMAPKDPYF
jgi:hypothetical protein